MGRCTWTSSTARPRLTTRTHRSDSEQNRFTVTRQLRYSRDEAQRALDIGLFIHQRVLPVFTFELKNNLTKQTVDDAVLQYQQDRNPREKVFEFGRCIALRRGRAGGAVLHPPRRQGVVVPAVQPGLERRRGHPPNPDGLAIDYLWREVLTRRDLTDILENYAQVVEAKDEQSGRKRRDQIWPRYHQLDVVRRLLADAGAHGAGRRYLIQHSAGSGKSNSIAWLAHQLIGLTRDDAPVFDSIIVVTDRVILVRSGTRSGNTRRLGGGRAHRPLGRSAPIHRERQEDHHLNGPEAPRSLCPLAARYGTVWPWSSHKFGYIRRVNVLLGLFVSGIGNALGAHWR